MPAYTGDQALLHLTKLYRTAYDLIDKGERGWYETDALYKAMQGYKDKTLGWVEPKLSVEEHREMFFEAMQGSNYVYGSLLDSLREFGVDEEIIQRFKFCEAKTLLELWRIPVLKFLDLAGQYPNEKIVMNAFFRLQEKIGFKKPVNFPSYTPRELEELQMLADHIAVAYKH